MVDERKSALQQLADIWYQTKDWNYDSRWGVLELHQEEIDVVEELLHQMEHDHNEEHFEEKSKENFPECSRWCPLTVTNLQYQRRVFVAWQDVDGQWYCDWARYDTTVHAWVTDDGWVIAAKYWYNQLHEQELQDVYEE